MKKPENVARFQREMKAVGRLDHPNIVRATDAGEVGGTHFLVMEYVAGRDLAVVLQEYGALSVADSCEVVRQAAVGLQHAHDHGLVHRDLKPSNLMLSAGGVKILDMGLARLHADEGVGELTAEGQLMGTVDYMAPEQAASIQTADIRADIYSLGCTLYKLLAGTAPFDGAEYSTLATKLLGHASKAPPPITDLCPALPLALAAVLDRMLAKERGRRYATPDDLAAALAPFCRGADLAALLGGPRAQGSDPTVADPFTTTQEGPAPAPFTQCDARAPLDPPAGTSGRRPSGRSGRRPVRLVCAAGALAAAVVAALVIRVETDRGELVIRSPHTDLHLTIRRNGQSVRDMAIQAGENSASVRSGDVEVLITGARADSHVVKNNKVTLSRGQTEIVTIERIAAPSTTDMPPEEANRQVAEWVLQHGGWVTVINDSGQRFDGARRIQDLPGRCARIIGLHFDFERTPPVSEAELLTQLRRVRGDFEALGTPSLLTDAGLAELAKIPALARLHSISVSNSDITDSGLSHLGAFRDLELVWFGGCQITGKGLNHLHLLPKLRTLDLAGNRLTDAGLAELRGLKLETLRVGFNPAITDAGAAPFTDMHTLRILAICGTKLGDRGLESLAGLTDLETLFIGRTLVTEKGLSFLSRFRKLKEVGVDGLPVTRERLIQTCDLPDLQRLGLGSEGMTFGAEDLAALSSLKKLEALTLFGSPRVTDEWLVPLAKLEGLKDLNVVQTKVTADGVKSLHAARPRCRIVSDHGTIEPASVGSGPR